MSAPHFIGVDVGGTKVAVASLQAGELSEVEIEATELGDSSKLIEQLVGVIERAREPNTVAVGIGVPSVVEFETGRIRASVNIPLADVPLRELMTERIGLPVFVDNDATCAALAEASEGGQVTCSELVMITVGTGVGGGCVLGGRVFRGATGAAPELGHIVMSLDLEDGAPDPGELWPREGTFECLSAGSALDRLALASAHARPDSKLGRILAEKGEVAGPEAVAAAAEGDAEARRIIAVLGERLGVGIANVVNLFDPLEVVVGGGVSSAGELLLAPARAAAGRFIVPGVGTKTQIRIARHGKEAGVLGAALLASLESAVAP